MHPIRSCGGQGFGSPYLHVSFCFCPPASWLQVLPEALQGLLGGLKFQKTMRWRGPAQFSRPVRWLLALHGQEVVPLHFAGLAAGRSTRVLRTSSQPEEQARPSLDRILSRAVNMRCRPEQGPGSLAALPHPAQLALPPSRHRVLSPVQVSSAAEYPAALLDGGITLGVQQRRTMIWSAVADVARFYGGYIPDASAQV